MGILDGKIAIITGAGQGLGEGAAHAMTQEGACVALWGRTFEKVERVANDINKAGGRRSGDQMRREHPCRGG